MIEPGTVVFSGNDEMEALQEGMLNEPMLNVQFALNIEQSTWDIGDCPAMRRVPGARERQVPDPENGGRVPRSSRLTAAR